MSSGSGRQWALYGGAGFIGQHLGFSILNRFPGDRVHMLDIRCPSEISWKLPLQRYFDSNRLIVRECDVRDINSLRWDGDHFDVMVNLAAVHREPGHTSEEYFGTNVSGAENVCRRAEEIGCPEIIFTSSISVYGVHDHSVDERSIPRPRTPYGQSKYQAETIHREWATRCGGRLSVVRPGVVFGHGEAGNVSRLLQEMMSRKRAIQIRPDCAKAGIYIEELIEVIHWLRNLPQQEGDFHLVNAVSNEGLTFNAYGRVLQELCNLPRTPLMIPGKLVGYSTSLLNSLSGWISPQSKFHPQRLAKLVLANDIRPAILAEMDYPFAWPLKRALADWLEQGL